MTDRKIAWIIYVLLFVLLLGTTSVSLKINHQAWTHDNREPVPTVTEPLTIRQKAKAWTLQRIGKREWKCADNIIERESRWIPNLWNSQGSSAYGLGQLKESYRWTKNKPMKQYIKAVEYMIYRYDTMCGAWRFWQRNGWY